MGRIGFRFYKKVLETFLALLKEEFHEDLVSLVLYGSIARGKGDALSDVDLLLILEDPHQNYHRRLDQVLDVEDRLRKSKEYRRIKEEIGQEPYFSFLLFSRKEAEENRYVFLDMIDDAKILYDKNGFFADRLNQIRARLQELGARKVPLEDGSWFWDLKPDLKVGEIFSL
ncbi:MAG: nucleotidyltransferase domain-containing protein [Syntrophaceae bacterium]|nr:nucleotidyltransferase domain-containing protein [Syntrophaceae bacterium]